MQSFRPITIPWTTVMTVNSAPRAPGWLGADPLREALADDPCRDVISQAFDLTEPEARYRLFHDPDGLACIVVHFTDRYQVGIWLRPDLRGRGLARPWLRKALAELPRGPLFCKIARTNAASLALFTACGFRKLSLRPSGGDEIALSLLS